MKNKDVQDEDVCFDQMTYPRVVTNPYRLLFDNVEISCSALNNYS